MYSQRVKNCQGHQHINSIIINKNNIWITFCLDLAILDCWDKYGNAFDAFLSLNQIIAYAKNIIVAGIQIMIAHNITQYVKY
jgi:hypothetical protein